jgi:hypothetical protein
MYLRHTTRHKDGKVHVYWQLVRSVRVGRRVLQQTVAHLGELDAQGRARAKALARAITGEIDQPDLFTAADEPIEAIPVQLNRVRLERGRTFGDVWLGWTLWRALRLDQTLAPLLPEGRETVPWTTMAAVLVLARLCEPSSELHIAEDWYRRTALEDLLALPAPLVNADRLYRALDRLLPHKTVLEQHLVARLGELFALEYDLLLYDAPASTSKGRPPRTRWPSAGTAATTGRTANRSASPSWSHGMGCRSATRSSRATGPMSPRSRRSSRRWKRAMDWPSASGSWIAA